MNADALFRLCSSLALLSWLLLALSLFLRSHLRRTVAALVTGAAVPALLALVYTAVIVTHWSGHRGGFGSLDDVSALFTDRTLLLAGWVHYRAFDLFVGSWEVREAERAEVPRWLVLPCLLLTFLFGPIGWVLFLLTRAVRSGRLALGE